MGEPIMLEDILRDSRTNNVLLFAQARTIFTKSDIAGAYDEETAQAAYALARDGRLKWHASGIYSIPTVGSEDRRVQEIIARTGAKPLSAKQRADNQQAIDQRILEDTLKRQKEAKFADKVRRHIKRNPVFLRHDVGSKFTVRAYAVLNEFEAAGLIRKIYDGIYAAHGVDPTGPEVKAFAEKLANHRQKLFQDIARVNALYKLPAVPLRKATLTHFNPDPLMNRVYMRIEGMLTIFARVGPGGYAVWEPKRGETMDGETYPPAAAEVIASRVFPEPIKYSDLVAKVAEQNGKFDVVDRCGSYAPMPATSGGSVDSYGPEDIDRLDLVSLAKSLPAPVDLIVDAAEPDPMFTLLSTLPNLRVHRKHLEVGDYVVPDRLVVERKTSADYVESLLPTDNRLSRQVHAMSQLPGRKMIVVEGGIFAHVDKRVPLGKRLNARARLQHVWGITLTETIGMRGTACELLLTLRAIAEEQPETAPMPALANTDTSYAASIAMLRVLARDGISLSRAEKLIAQFGDIATLARAHPTETAEVADMPIEAAKALYEAVNGGRTAPKRKPRLRVAA